MRITARFVPECGSLVVALLIVSGNSSVTAGIPSAQARNWVQAGQQLAPGGTALATIASTDCARDAAQLPSLRRRGYYVPFVTNGPPPGNPNQTGYLFDHHVSGPIAQGSWSTVVYGPRLGSQQPIPSFQWVKIQGAFCGGVFWERQWQYWRQSPAIAHATTSMEYQLRACRAADLRASSYFQGATGSMAGGVAITNRSASVCVISGRPHIQLQDTKGRILPTVYHAGSGDGQGAPVQSTELVPRARALAFVVWQNWCGHAAPAVALLVTLPGSGDRLIVRAGELGTARCDAPHQPSTLSVAPFQPAPAIPSETIRQYYAEINQRRYDAAYRYLAASGRAPRPAFSRGYQRTIHVTLERLAIPAYIIHRTGADYTCAGIQFQAHQRSGSVVEYGGWYLVQVRLQSDGHLVLSGSVIHRNSSLTVPTRGNCAGHIP